MLKKIKSQQKLHSKNKSTLIYNAGDLILFHKKNKNLAELKRLGQITRILSPSCELCREFQHQCAICASTPTMDIEVRSLDSGIIVCTSTNMITPVHFKDLITGSYKLDLLKFGRRAANRDVLSDINVDDLPISSRLRSTTNINTIIIKKCNKNKHITEKGSILTLNKNLRQKSIMKLTLAPTSDVSSLSNDQMRSYITGCIIALQILPKDNKNYYIYNKNKLLYEQGRLLNPLIQVVRLTEIPGFYKATGQ